MILYHRKSLLPSLCVKYRGLIGFVIVSCWPLFSSACCLIVKSSLQSTYLQSMVIVVFLFSSSIITRAHWVPGTRPVPDIFSIPDVKPPNIDKTRPAGPDHRHHSSLGRYFSLATDYLDAEIVVLFVGKIKPVKQNWWCDQFQKISRFAAAGWSEEEKRRQSGWSDLDDQIIGGGTIYMILMIRWLDGRRRNLHDENLTTPSLFWGLRCGNLIT